ncbi:unnamed protein product [Mytilus edulis]|uniref:Zinc finger PHD-type domain-containing protein n=1 Tax=Mytilus edulis TaxID=6550 RepID=A0A8S3PSG1_MYTED|nr:unnamed protein product [Mytilus edulis]
MNASTGRQFYITVLPFILHLHPEVVIRKPEKLSTLRSRLLNATVVCNYFKELQTVLQELTPTSICNMDETRNNLEHQPARNKCGRPGALWIQCCGCERWFHRACSGLTYSRFKQMTEEAVWNFTDEMDLSIKLSEWLKSDFTGHAALLPATEDTDGEW